MKNVLITILFFLWASFALNAQKILYEPVELTINSEDGIFAKGDTIKVYALLTEDKADALHIKVVAAGETLTDKGLVLKAGEKTLVHTAVWDQAKSVMVNVFAESNPKVFTAVGYIVAPEDFAPGYDSPADLQDYWKEQIALMRKSRIKVKKSHVRTPFEGDGEIDCFDLEIKMHQGNPVRAYLAVPKNAKAGSLPIYILAHGAGVNDPGNSSSIKSAVSYARKGAIGIDINAHGMLNGQPQEYYDKLKSGELANYSTRELTNRDDYYFRLMYLRLVRALDYLTSMKEWDGKHVLIAGSSQGGGQAAALAGIDPRVTAAVISVPALTDMGAYRCGRINGWPVRNSYKEGVQKELAAQILPYFDAALLVKFTKASLFYQAGLVDVTCDPACVFASFNNAGSGDKTIMCYPYRPHGSVAKRYSRDYNEKIQKAKVEFINRSLTK